MKRSLAGFAAIAAFIGTPAFADDFTAGLSTIQQEWAVANYQTTGDARSAAFDALVEHASGLRAQYPARVEAVAWEGIVLSSYAGEVSAMSAMKYAKAARAALEQAEKLDATALGGGSTLHSVRCTRRCLAVSSASATTSSPRNISRRLWPSIPTISTTTISTASSCSIRAIMRERAACSSTRWLHRPWPIVPFSTQAAARRFERC